jgi:hypothetical protein
MDKSIINITKKNLSLYFLLPGISLNVNDFGGEDNIINGYLSTDYLDIYVEVKEAVTRFESNMVVRSNSIIHVFEIPDTLCQDVIQFTLGKYSMFSESLKHKIKHHSSLTYKRYNPLDEFTVATDIRLLALDKEDVVKRFWERNIYSEDEESAITEDSELLSKPTDKDYLQLNP